MDWIESETQKPPTNKLIWIQDCYGDAHLGKVKLVKDRHYFRAKLVDGNLIKRAVKWATYDVIY